MTGDYCNCAHTNERFNVFLCKLIYKPEIVSLRMVFPSQVINIEIPYWSGKYVTFTHATVKININVLKGQSHQN